MKFELWLAFVIGAILSWGTYVPVIHHGQSLIGGKPSDGAARAFLCVGLAYFLTAVVLPLILFGLNLAGGEQLSFADKEGVFNGKGVAFATLGGVAGAAGALCIILAIKSGGSPLFIAPLVFAGAPIINAIVSLLWHPPKFMPGPMFYAGIVLAAVGAGMVLYSKGDLDRRSREARMAEAKAAKVAELAAQPAEGSQP
jgi:uncharacterized membrane protein